MARVTNIQTPTFFGWAHVRSGDVFRFQNGGNNKAYMRVEGNRYVDFSDGAVYRGEDINPSGVLEPIGSVTLTR